MELDGCRVTLLSGRGCVLQCSEALGIQEVLRKAEDTEMLWTHVCVFFGNWQHFLRTLFGASLADWMIWDRGIEGKLKENHGLSSKNSEARLGCPLVLNPSEIQLVCHGT